jgi:REP element-mobilizing transposase RayT
VRRWGQTFANLINDIVFSTKDRTELIVRDRAPRLYSYIGEVIENLDGVLICAGGMPDHIHLLVSLSPKFAVADVVRDIKANSSRFLKQKFPDMRRFAWQNGYGIFSVSESQKSVVRRYIERQESHHKKVSYKEELLAILAKHKMKYDPKYIWE